MTRGLGAVIRAGIARRRLQTLVLMLTTTLAVTASVLAADLLVASSAPFERAFDDSRGAHMTARFDGSKASASQVEETGRAGGVRAVAGPFPLLSVSLRVVAHNGGPAPDQLTAMPIVGRADPGGPVDRLDLIAGAWAGGPGQIVLNSEHAPLAVGDKVQADGGPELTVVGLARSVGDSAGGWVTPQQVAALAPGAPPQYQMLYRFDGMPTGDELLMARTAIAAAAPAGSLTDASTYLKIRQTQERTTGEYVPFVAAFAVVGLAMSLLIIAVVVSGAVGAATRRIGILKSLGFTPGQVVRGYALQALIPAAVGAVAGTIAGALLALPVLSEAQAAYRAGTVSVPFWIDVVVPVAALAAVAVAAVVPALRAGRLRTVDAIAVGRTTGARRAARGRTATRLAARLPLPRAITLGLASPFTRPARSLTMLVAVVLGTVGVTLGVGLALSLNRLQHALGHETAGTIHVQMPGTGFTTGPVDPSAVNTPELAARAATAIAAQPGTGRYFGTGHALLGVTGVSSSIRVVSFTGDASWANYQLLDGAWFHGPGEAVVPPGFLTFTGTRVGDTVTLTDAGRTAEVRIVGEVFDLQDEGMAILTDAESLRPLGTVPPADEFTVAAGPGTDRDAYAGALTAALRPLGATVSTGSAVSETVAAMDSLAGILTALLVAVAGLGVLNTVVLDTRERVHDLGIFKALGMTPGQVVAMVLTSIGVTGVAAGVAGVPVGVLVHHFVVPLMGSSAGTRIPDANIDVYGLAVLLPLLLGGLVIAVAGGLAPTGWAARTPAATALRSE